MSERLAEKFPKEVCQRGLPLKVAKEVSQINLSKIVAREVCQRGLPEKMPKGFAIEVCQRNLPKR